jgi:hypothetical protein
MAHTNASSHQKKMIKTSDKTGKVFPDFATMEGFPIPEYDTNPNGTSETSQRGQTSKNPAASTDTAFVWTVSWNIQEC